MENITDGSQGVVPSREDKNPDSGRSKSVKKTKRLETMASELKRVKNELAALKKQEIREREEHEEVNGSEAATNDEVDGIGGDANEKNYESEGDENEEDENEEEDGNEEDENEEGSDGDVNDEEVESEGVQNEEDLNGDENKKPADRAEESAGRMEKAEANGDGGKGRTGANDVSTNIEKGEAMVNERKDVKIDPKEENMPIKKAKRARKRRKPTANSAASKDDNKPDELLNASKKDASTAEEVKMVDGMGLIFMCNAKTKQDCFRYKILGLPASKKELVSKIYKGMRLFLFDVDLKLMYGIFKAAAPGGYNIEPQAFKSAYPAQVRFRVLSDCLPLPEKEFKAAIKENYYGRNKFSNQLSSEQVKRLCKLFQTSSKLSKNKRPIENVGAETEPSRPSKRRRRANTDAVRTTRPDPGPVERAADATRARPARGPRTSSHGRGRGSINHREAHRRPHLERERRTPPAPLPYRREQHGRSIRARELDPYIGRREREIQDLLPPPRRVLSPPPAPSAVGAVPYDYYYRRDPYHSLMVDPRNQGSRVMDSETRHVLLPHDSHLAEYHHNHRDALSSLYREPPQSLYHAPPPSLSAYSRGQSPLYYRY